jgi:hypothetical protein
MKPTPQKDLDLPELRELLRGINERALKDRFPKWLQSPQYAGHGFRGAGHDLRLRGEL